MRKILVTLFTIIGLTSCGDYQKALKSEDVSVKFAKGTELYDAGKYSKANRLFVQIVPNYRGKPQAEKLMFMYSNTFYMMRDYSLSAYQFERFADAYPKSEKAEEAQFLSAKSYYMLSPVYSKEQKETREALEKLQIFIDKYPESTYLAQVNEMVKELDYKLEKKDFEIAKQYNRVSDYEASIKAFDNFLLQFPGSVLKEEAMFYRLDSAYKLAINSTERKKEARVDNALSLCGSFKRYFPNSEHSDEIENMNTELTVLSQQYQNKS
ncbi:MAG TPA: outer membrane protein assembly factor BamD [Aquaticitalea sp.]|nr:outer membrane protein assembly factor BamD [Aquaticitalea sp.]